MESKAPVAIGPDASGMVVTMRVNQRLLAVVPRLSTRAQAGHVEDVC